MSVEAAVSFFVWRVVMPWLAKETLFSALFLSQDRI
jgi:hypothetical protein